VVGIETRDLQIKLADNVKVRVAKSAIAGLEGEEQA
jgi:preprotein translocase subunit YajC